MKMSLKLYKTNKCSHSYPISLLCMMFDVWRMYHRKNLSILYISDLNQINTRCRSDVDGEKHHEFWRCTQHFWVGNRDNSMTISCYTWLPDLSPKSPIRVKRLENACLNARVNFFRTWYTYRKEQKSKTANHRVQREKLTTFVNHIVYEINLSWLEIDTIAGVWRARYAKQYSDHLDD